MMGDGRGPDSGGKEHLGQGGRAPRLKGGVLQEILHLKNRQFCHATKGTSN